MHMIHLNPWLSFKEIILVMLWLIHCGQSLLCKVCSACYQANSEFLTSKRIWWKCRSEIKVIHQYVLLWLWHNMVTWDYSRIMLWKISLKNKLLKISRSHKSPICSVTAPTWQRLHLIFSLQQSKFLMHVGWNYVMKSHFKP